MIKFNNPFELQGQWYKGNLHCHTTMSDGGLTPEEVRDLYHKNGYDFLGISDHNKLTRIEELAGMIHIPCEEVDIWTHNHSNVLFRSLHLVAVNISEGLELTAEQKKELTVNTIIKMIKERGGEIILAHPYWSNLTINEMMIAKECLGVEVYNTGCEVIRANGFSYVHWDQMIQNNVQMFGFATDDAHHYIANDEFISDACGGWIMVKAQELATEAIVKSIRDGLFYASMGPEIKNIVIDNDEIHVETSLVRSISFVGYDSQGKKCYCKNGGLIESASFKFKDSTIYLRIQCVDVEGNMAWANPICFRDDTSSS